MITTELADVSASQDAHGSMWLCRCQIRCVCEEERSFGNVNFPSSVHMGMSNEVKIMDPVKNMAV